MARIVALGTASMVNDAEHDYTHLLLIGEEDSPILIDVGENPLGKIKDLGLQDEALQDIILTHFQSNMVGGLPNMFMHMWLQGRTASVRIYGLMHCLERIRSMLSFHGWELWPNFFPVGFFGVREEAGAPVIDNADFTIHAFPMAHKPPTIGLRILNKHTGRVVAYTAETAPHENVLWLAHDADILIHESAGNDASANDMGNSTAEQAGRLATEANAKSLYLINYEVWDADPTELIPAPKAPIKAM
jgi:ribonuclease Z